MTDFHRVSMYQPNTQREGAAGVDAAVRRESNAISVRGGHEGPAPIVRPDQQQQQSSEARSVETRGAFSNAVYVDAPMPGDGRAVLASARKANGGRALAASEIGAGDVVTVGGIEMRVAEAERLGFLSRDAGGFYRETGATDARGGIVEAPQRAQEAPKAEQADAPSFPELDERTEALRSEYEGAADEAARVAQQFIAEGNASETAINQLAARLSKEPAAVREQIATMRAGYEAQAAQVAERWGLPAEQVWKFAREQKPGALKDAMRNQVQLGSVAGYAELGRAAMLDYLGKVSSGAVPAEVSGVDDISVQRQGGRTLVTVPGVGQMELPAAVRAGLVEVVAVK